MRSGKSSNKNIQNNITNYSIRGRPKKGVCGLKNLKNTCFMNCIYQCLFKTVELADYFLTNKYENDLKPIKKKSNKVEFARSFADLFEQFWNGKNSVLIPSVLLERFKDKNNVLFNDNQEDAEEFLQYLLNVCLHEELSIELTDKRDVKSWPIQDSQIKRIFEVVIETTQKCECDKESDYIQDCTLRLQLKNLRTKYDLENLLEEKFKRTKTKCSECKKIVEVTNRISRLPPVLIITLNRTVRNKKLQNPVQFPVNGLNMNGYLGGTGQVGEYNLYAVSNHIGDRINFGHYTAKCKSIEEDAWWKFDDKKCTKDKEPSYEESDEAYILFYTSTDRSAYKNSILNVPILEEKSK